MDILVSPHNEQEEKVLRAFPDSLQYDYSDTSLDIPPPSGEKRQTIEEYNKEIDDAEAEFERGNFTTHEDLIEEMKSW